MQVAEGIRVSKMKLPPDGRGRKAGPRTPLSKTIHGLSPGESVIVEKPEQWPLAMAAASYWARTLKRTFKSRQARVGLVIRRET